MKRSKKRPKGTDKKTDSKPPRRHVRLPDSGGSDETPYIRRCMSTELLQLLCLQRSLLDVTDISSSRQEETPPLRSSEDTSSSSNHRHPFVNISMWSLSTKGDGGEDSQERGLKDKNPYFLDFVDLYTKVKDFQATRCGNQTEYEAFRSVSLPSLKELPSFAHLLSKLTSYFDEDIEEFRETKVEDGLNDSSAPSYIKAFFNGDRPQDHGFGPIIPNILSDDSKKSSLNDFLSRISRDPDRFGEDCFCNKSKDLASRLQAGTSRRQDQTKAFSKNKKKSLKNKNREQSTSHKKMRGRPSKSDTYRKPFCNSDRSKVSRHDGKFQTSFVKSLRNNGKEHKKLLELFQLLFKKHKARERLSVISKLPKRKTLNSNQAKSKHKSHARSGQKTLERKQGISCSKNRNVNFDDDATKTSGQVTDTSTSNNIEDSSQKSTCPLNVQSNCSSPTGICKHPIPSPRKHVLSESKNAEKLQNEVFNENLVGYSGMTCSWDMVRSKFHVECSRVRDSSSTPTFQRDKDDEKLYRSNFKDGSLSNSVISPESTFCEGSSNEERELDLPLTFPREQSPELVKERYFNCQPPKTNETSASERFWANIMRTLRTPNRQRPVMAEFSKSRLIPGPFSASLTNLLKEKLPDLKLDGDVGTPSCYKMPSFHASLSSATSLPSGLNGSLITNKHDDNSAASEDRYSIYCPGRKDSVMGEKSLSSILTLKEEPLPAKYPSPAGTFSSELFLDDYWTNNLDTSTSYDSQMNEDSLQILESKFQDVDFSAKLTETLLQATTIRDEASVQASICKPNTTSVCIQTSDVFDRCVASTSISSLTKKSESTSSTLMIVRQLTKPHKLISVPLSNAPLIAQVSKHQKSPESKVRRSVRIISQRRVKKVVRSPSPPVETFRSKPLQENRILDKQAEIAKNLDHSATRARGNVYLRSMILFGEKSNKSPKLRKSRTKKLMDKNAEIRMKYFENRNKNVSFRNSSNINQNFRDGTARERNSNSNRKVKVTDDGSSNTDEDVVDQPLLSIPDNLRAPQQTDFNANGRYSRFMNQGRFEEALETTYEKDFSVDWEDPWSGERALVGAVVKSQHEIVERLLELGSILDAPDCNGRTAFLASAIQVDHRAAWLLLSHGLEIFCSAPLKVAHGRAKNIAQFARFLELAVLSGYNPGREVKWFETVLKSNSPGNDKDLAQATLNLLSSCKEAPSLTMSCFVTIRRHLSKVNKGRSIALSLRHLPLPRYLRSYLCMDDIM